MKYALIILIAVGCYHEKKLQGNIDGGFYWLSLVPPTDSIIIGPNKKWLGIGDTGPSFLDWSTGGLIIENDTTPVHGYDILTLRIVDSVYIKGRRFFVVARYSDGKFIKKDTLNNRRDSLIHFTVY